MTMVIGVNCDACGGFDIEALTLNLNEDSFPRNGWMSINVHDEKGNPEGQEMNVCSVPCLEKLAKILMRNSPAQDENDSHNHPHTE